MAKAKAPRVPPFDGYSDRIVPGKGPVPADLMFIGEAPGANEDRMGEPFVGLAGQFLDTLLAEAQLERSRVYITNIVKRRPPNNREPTKPEIKFYKPSLLEEIERVNPKIIVAMGNIPLIALLGYSGIKKHRGVEVEVNGRKVLPTFHPSYCLRTGGQAALKDEHSPAALVRKDLKRAARLLAGDVQVPPTAMRIIRHPNEFLNGDMMHVAQAEIISYDVETKGWNPLDPEGWMLGVGISVAEGQGYYFILEPNPDSDMIALLQRIFLLKRKYVAHNGKFDNRWLRRYGIEVNQTFDTMLAAFLLNENRRMALEHLAVEELGAEPYHQETQALLDTGKADEVPVEKLAARCCRDVDMTMRLYLKYKPQLEADLGLRRVFSYLMMPVSRLLEEVEAAGLPIAAVNLSQVKQELETKAAEYEAELKRLAGFEPDAKVNFNSTKIIANVLYTRLGLPVIKATPKTGAPSTDEKVLLRLRELSPFVDSLMKYRKCQKYLSSYCERWEPRLRDGRLYGSYRFTTKDQSGGIRTGRLGSDLQQMPREDTGKIIGVSIKNLVVASPGHVLLEADRSQAELRDLAWIAGEPTMLRIFLEGGDIHTETARDIVRSTDKDGRQKAKGVNFGFAYGMGAKHFRDYAFEEYGLKFTEQEAEEIRRRFFAKFSHLPAYYMRQEVEVRKNLAVRTPLGRIRRLPDILSPNKETRQGAIRQAINTPVQSVASDLTLLAAVEARKVLPASCRLIALVHDSMLWEVPEGKVGSAAGTVKQIMEQVVPDLVETRFKLRIPIPLEAEVKVGRRWGEMKVLDREAMVGYDRTQEGRTDAA